MNGRKLAHLCLPAKAGATKRAKIEYPYLNAHLHIHMNSNIYFQENPSSCLGGVGLTNFF